MLLRAIPGPASEAPSRSCDLPPRVSGEAPCRPAGMESGPRPRVPDGMSGGEAAVPALGRTELTGCASLLPDRYHFQDALEGDRAGGGPQAVH